MEWISAKTLLDALSVGGGQWSAVLAICRRAHAGLLGARATALIVDDGEPKRDEMIPREFWWAEGHAALEQDWARGDFSTWIDQQVEIKAFGVMFDKREAEAMGADFSCPVDGQEKSPLLKAGGPTRPDEAKCDELAASFDANGIAKRDVKAPMIAERWNPSDGPVPKKEVITSRMKGQSKGRRAEG